MQASFLFYAYKNKTPHTYLYTGHSLDGQNRLAILVQLASLQRQALF
jgi:hypothetical protein